MGVEYLQTQDMAGDAASSILGQIRPAAVATLADFASTLYNSTAGMLGADDISTTDILEKVSKDALSFYNEHQEGVQAASFLAGIILPQAATIKALNMTKAGMTSLGKTGFLTDTFTGGRAKALQGELKTLFENSRYATPEYNAAMRKLYATKIGENVIDSAVFEGMMVGTLNAHPYMEDYMQDPYSNFLLWAGVGAGIGGVLGVIGSRVAVRQATGEVATEGIATVLKDWQVNKVGATNAEIVQTKAANIKNFEAIIANKETNQFTRDLAEQFIIAERNAKLQAVDNAAMMDGDTLKHYRPLLEKILEQPMFMGVHKIGLPNLLKSTKDTATRIEVDAIVPLKDVEGNMQTVFYRPTTGEFFDSKSVAAAGWAVDAKTFKINVKEVNLHDTKVGGEFLLENLTRSNPSAHVDARYLNEMKRWETVKPEDMRRIGINPEDLPRMQAARAWLAKQNPEVQRLVRFNVTRAEATFEEAQRFIQSGNAGVKPTYVDDVKRLVETKGMDYVGRVSPELSEAITGWVHGTAGVSIREWIGRLRAGMDAFMRGTVTKEGAKYKELARELWEKGAPFRAEMRKLADPEGYVYLYRTLRGAAKGSTSIESFTIKRGLSSIPGDQKLYRVHTDDIIGNLGPGKITQDAGGGFGEYEILVGSASRETQQSLNIPVHEAPTAVNLPVKAGEKNQYTAEQLVQHFNNEVQRQVAAMMAKGDFSIHEIAARMNMTPDAVQMVAMGAKVDEIPNAFRVASVQDIETALNPNHRMLALRGNKYAVEPSTLLGNLDTRSMDVAHQQAVEWLTEGSKSSIAKDLIHIFSPLDDAVGRKEIQMWLAQLKQNLGQINNQLIGSPMFQTLDNALRNVKDGALITHIGKQVQEVMDKKIKELLEPLSLRFKQMANNSAAQVEFTAAYNKLMSMQGWRDIVVGDDGRAMIVQKRIEKVKGKTVETLVPVADDGKTYFITQPEVIDALQGTRVVSDEILKISNLMRSIRGHKPVTDLGFYLPPPNLVGKYFSYVIDNTGKQGTRVLVANTEEELRGLEAAYKTNFISKNPTLEIVSRAKQEEHNFINMYEAGELHYTIANNELKHGGSIAFAIPPADARFINGVMQGYEQQILANGRKFMELYLSDITGKLDMLSGYNQLFTKNQPLKFFDKGPAPDAAKVVKNGLLGINNLQTSTTWKTANDFFDSQVNRVSRGLDNITKTFKGKEGSIEHFEALSAELASKGVTNPWRTYDEYIQSVMGAGDPVSRRIVSAATGMMSTFQLRLADAAFALVNLISMPILTHGALMEGLPATTLPNGSKIKFPLRIMSDAMRHMNSPRGKALSLEWEKQGLINQVVREYVDRLGAVHGAYIGKDATAKGLEAVNTFQNSKAVTWFTKPADAVESLTRNMAMHTGYLMAKHAYPGISDAAATIHAAAVADRIIGNYYSFQRPVLFQGTMGSAISLYQTYMLTFAQHVYRQLEKGQFAALSGTMLAQAGIFGMSSLPGYGLLSEFIGKHMSNDNYDLVSGTYRALDDPIAEIVLYGLPSSITQSALYTRGDITPRIPTPDNLAIINTAVGTYNALGKLFNGLVNQPGVEGKLQAMLEALSLQTISRPIARMAEVAAGESITTKGQTVATSDEVWTFNGVFSRMLSVRPLEEQALRYANHLNSFYGAADYEARQKAVNKIRTAVRAGDLQDDLIDNVAAEYLRHGGSANGWNSVVNEVFVRTEDGLAPHLLHKLEPTSPLRRMISDTF